MHKSKSKSNAHLGRTLVSLNDSKRRNTFKHTKCFNSITEQNSLQCFLLTSQLADRNFKGEKEPLEIITSDRGNLYNKKIDNFKNSVKDCDVTIPRRIYYDKKLSVEELSRKESYAFLLWKDTIAEFEKNHRIVIPFENNLEVWKQLWRVIEKSDILVQVLDARDPLLFRSCDLEKYVKEMNPSKRNFLLLNKSEFLNKQQRELWSIYFSSFGLDFAFWSAVNECQFPSLLAHTELVCKPGLMDDEVSNQFIMQTNSSASLKQDYLGNFRNFSKDMEIEISDIDSLPINEQKYSIEPSTGFDRSLITDMTLPKIADDLGLVHACKSDVSSSNNKPPYLNKLFNNSTTYSCDDSSRILNSQELISYFNQLRKPDNSITTIGMVGFPNVGKSSTINALIGKKVVATSSTPGKTKHFQTHFLDTNTVLCDCPGLVFPNFNVTKSQLICSGVLPLDQMKDYTMPIVNICHLVPKIILEHFYNLTLESESSMPDYSCIENFLTCFAESRNYVLSHGHPDFGKAAKSILKDYIQGNICFAIGPPSIPLDQFNKELIYSATKYQGHKIGQINNADNFLIDKEFFTGSVNLESTKKFRTSTQRLQTMSSLDRTYSKKHFNNIKKHYFN